MGITMSGKSSFKKAIVSFDFDINRTNLANVSYQVIYLIFSIFCCPPSSVHVLCIIHNKDVFHVLSKTFL